MAKKNEYPGMREPIAKLAKMITNRIPIALGIEKIKKEDAEYWGLDALLTDEQAEVALSMGRRKPRTIEEVVKLCGKDRETTEKILEELSVMGIVEYNWENPQHEKQYLVPMFVPGSAEFTNMNSKLLQEHPEMGRFFEEMSRIPLEKVTPMVRPSQ